MDKIIYLDKSNQVICWGDAIICKKYINQMYSISSNILHYEEYDVSGRYSSFYEDYEVYNIQGTDVYLTLGEIKMIRDGCQEETSNIKFIENELEHLMTLTHVYSNSIIEELTYMRDFMKKLYNIHAKYNMENVFTNLDIDALHHAYQTERENKGLPIVYID